MSNPVQYLDAAPLPATFGAPASYILAPTTPASQDALGTAGSMVWDSSYIYVCSVDNHWKRIALDDSPFFNPQTAGLGITGSAATAQ